MSKLIAKNKRAFFENIVLEQFSAGIKLKGSEVKSVRNGNISFGESHCFIRNGEIFIKNMYISEYDKGGKHNNHNPLRERKLLLNKKEIVKLSEKVKEKGLTIMALSIILSDNGFIKVEIALVRGKKLYDKRESLKVKDLEREVKQTF